MVARTRFQREKKVDHAAGLSSRESGISEQAYYVGTYRLALKN